MNANFSLVRFQNASPRGVGLSHCLVGGRQCVDISCQNHQKQAVSATYGPLDKPPTLGPWSTVPHGLNPGFFRINPWNICEGQNTDNCGWETKKKNVCEWCLSELLRVKNTKLLPVLHRGCPSGSCKPFVWIEPELAVTKNEAHKGKKKI